MVDIFVNVSNCTMISGLADSTSTRYSGLKFGWTYWITSMIIVPTLLAFVYYAAKYDLRKSEGNVDKDDYISLESNSKKDSNNNMEMEELIPDKTDKDSLKKNKNMPLLYKVSALVTIFLLMTAFYGGAISYGYVGFTYAVKSDLNFSKQKAANLMAVFWLSFVILGAATTLLQLIVPITAIMVSSVLTSIAGSILLFMLPHNDISIWIVSVAFGFGSATMYSCVMAWLNIHFSINGKTVAVPASGLNFGDIVMPAAVGALIGIVSPISFVYCILILMTLATIFMIALLVMTWIYEKFYAIYENEDKNWE